MKTWFPIFTAVVVLLAWGVLAWFLGVWLGVNPALIWVLRVGLWAIGLIGLVGYLVLSRGAAEGENKPVSLVSEVEYSLKAAARRLRSFKEVKVMASLPAVFVLGDSGATKTSSLARSGLAPEVLCDTRACCIWYARRTIFIDPAANLMRDTAARLKLFRKLRPVLQRRMKAPTRSVVLVVDCEKFIKASGVSAMPAKAREYNVLLTELARELGCAVPVYVLFSKADKISNFQDYVENLSEAEAAEVLGVSLAVPPPEQPVTYSERQSARLTDAFATLTRALSDRRRLYLAREQSAARLANIYEFPREFSKLRPLMVEFLVDVGFRGQSAAGTGIFLRGFYFAGERGGLATASALSEGREAKPGTQPKPVFLQRLFSDVVLADRVGAQATPARPKSPLSVKLLLLAAAAMGLAAAAWLSLSFVQNRMLVQDAIEAARPAPVDSLERLSSIRAILAKLDNDAQTRPQWQSRAMLYKGGDVRAALRTVYFGIFRRLLLEPTQQTLVRICSEPQNYRARGFDYIYDALKSYLIITSNHDKSTAAFLAPALLTYWENGRTIGAETESEARKNFAYYAETLPGFDPYPRFDKPDAAAVTHARAYLNSFPRADRIYNVMLRAAGGNQKPLSFNQDYPGSAETLVNSFIIEPWFTKAGYLAFQTELVDVDAYMNAEDWVLGRQSRGSEDSGKLVAALRTRYEDEFTEAWSGYVEASEVVRYKDISDAVSKLRNLGSPGSALLLNLCVASENTSIAAAEVKDTFEPLQSVAPTGCMTQPTTGPTSAYLDSLHSLANNLAGMGPKANPEDLQRAVGMTQAAQAAAKTLTAGSYVDPTLVAKTSQLLTAPIANVSALFKAGK
jgi:type VI secretion system protein ImpL